MDFLYTLFTTRELASIIWLLIIFLFIISKRDIRKAFVSLMKTLLSKWLGLFFLSIIIYAIIITLLLSRFFWWDWLYLKDVFIWLITTGVLVCINAIDKKSDEYYIRNVLKDNIKWLMIAEFFFNTFTFHLVAELLLLPFVTIISIMEQSCTVKKGKKYELVGKFLSGVLTFTGIVILFNTIAVSINEFSSLEFMDLVISFFIPIIYLILFIPFDYFWEIYSKYQILFCRLTISFGNDKKKFKLKYRLFVLKICGLSVKNVILFQQAYYNKHYFNMNEDNFYSLVEEFYKLKKQK